MQAAKKILSNFRTARKNELYSIVHCDFHLPGTSSLTPRARRYLFFFIALIRSGYHSVAAPMAVISDAIYRAQGQTSSVRTLRSALAELESAGYLHRRKCRLGGDRSNAVIDLVVERFVFWTKIKYGNVIPCNTQSHISSCRQKLPADDRTIPTNRVNSQYSSDNNYKEANDHARCKKSANKHKYHPIVYTLLCVMANNRQKHAAIEIAKREISGGENLSGVDWEYYERLWPALDCMPGGRRERTAMSDIIPPLIRCLSSVSHPATSEVPIPMKEDHPTSPGTELPTLKIAPPATSEQISILISMLSKTCSEQKNERELRGDLRQTEQLSAENEQKQSLSQEEMRILLLAKQSVKNRR